MWSYQLEGWWGETALEILRTGGSQWRIVWDVVLHCKILIFILSGLREIGWAGKGTYVYMSIFVLPGPMCISHMDHSSLQPRICICWWCSSCSVVSDSASLWTVAHQAPLSMQFPRQEYWSVLPFYSPGDLPDPGMELTSPAWAGGFLTAEPPAKPISIIIALFLRDKQYSEALCSFPKLHS